MANDLFSKPDGLHSSGHNNGDQNLNDDNHEDENRDYVSELVGEGKKYKDPNALAKAKIFADEHIKRLEQEAAERARELDKRLVVEDMMAEIKALASKPQTEHTNVQDKVESNDKISKDEIASLVTSELVKLTERQKQEQNLKQVQDQLLKTFGPNYSEKLSQRAKDLELSQEFLNQLASVNPKAFLRMIVEPAAQVPNYTPPNTKEGFRSNGHTGEKTYKYYQKIRKENPRLYATLQMEMYKQAEKLGDAFYN